MFINNIKFDFTSFPTHYIQENSIRIIHHGMASPDRYIHKMIEVMDYVDDRFTLDLMLVSTYYQDYFKTLQQMTSDRKNTRIIPIVPFEEIIPFTSQYDIGMFLVPFSTFNLKMCLPNKFFEFIQARLAIAIGPSPEMAKLVQQYHLGILQYKENSNKAAKILNAQNEGEKLLKIVEEVLG